LQYPLSRNTEKSCLRILSGGVCVLNENEVSSPEVFTVPG
jgi:hypothetical protein